MIGRMLIGIFVAAALLSAERVFTQGPRPGRDRQVRLLPRAWPRRSTSPATGCRSSLRTGASEWSRRQRAISPACRDPAARAVGNAWDPAKDTAAGLQCKAYGAAGIMRVPGRLHVTWEDDNTLQVDFDAGTQTRLLHFGAWTAPRRRADMARRLGRRVGDAASWPRAPGGRRRVVAPARLGPVCHSAVRLSESGHDAHAPGLPAEKRRPYSATTVLTNTGTCIASPTAISGSW